MPTDFKVGLDIGIYGRVIRIYDADQYTREFFQNIGQPQPEPQMVPDDNFKKSMTKPTTKKDQEMKEFLEKSLGGGRVPSQKQFLDNDRKVLRFYTKCDDHPFIINYYLADDTVEIREVHHPNDGRDSFSQLLRRQKLPQNFALNQPGQNFIGDNYLTDDEIMPGGTIDAFGRTFRIQGVDQFTQQYYKQKYGRHFEIGQVEFPKPREPKPLVVPPHNGFGDEEDSLGYVYKLMPDKPKRDFFKYVDNDKKILRFTARLNTRVPEDVDRRFIISFYLSDDTVSIFEPGQKNSGIVEGKFLERRKYKNVDKNMEFVTPTDLAIGGDVKINGYSFHILSCDDYTQKYLDNYSY